MPQQPHASMPQQPENPQHSQPQHQQQPQQHLQHHMFAGPSPEQLQAEQARLRAEVQREAQQQTAAAAAAAKAERAKSAWTAHRSEQGQVSNAACMPAQSTRLKADMMSRSVSQGPSV